MERELVVIVVQHRDAPNLVEAVVASGERVTRLATRGGFLTEPSAVLLVGIDPRRYDDLMATVATVCRRRVETVVAAIDVFLALAAPLEVEVGGAVVFSLPVVRHVQLRGTRPDPTTQEVASVEPVTPDPAPNASPMQLVVAIVNADDTDAVTTGLLTSGYRLTRIDTTGGFLRRGNATLLIGVPADEVDDVLSIIDATSTDRTEPTPLDKGMPAYAATVFVLDTARHARL